MYPPGGVSTPVCPVDPVLGHTHTEGFPALAPGNLDHSKIKIFVTIYLKVVFLCFSYYIKKHEYMDQKYSGFETATISCILYAVFPNVLTKINRIKIYKTNTYKKTTSMGSSPARPLLQIPNLFRS